MTTVKAQRRESGLWIGSGRLDASAGRSLRRAGYLEKTTYFPTAKAVLQYSGGLTQIANVAPMNTSKTAPLCRGDRGIGV